MDDIHNFKVAVTNLAKTFKIRIDHDRDIDWHNFCASLLTYLKRHAEWSEEDEENFKWFDKFFRAESILVGGRDIPQDKYLWFKSLRPQPKQEWGKEDKEHIESILHRMDVQGAGSPYGRLKEDIIWLKSLLSRLKPSDNWKPTEEQLNALYLASYGGELSSEDCLELDSLLIDLRKNYNL